MFAQRHDFGRRWFGLGWVGVLALAAGLQAQENGARSVIVEVYFDSARPAAAVPADALDEWKAEREAVVIVERDIQQESNAQRFAAIARHYGLDQQALPVVYGLNRAFSASGAPPSWTGQLNEMLKLEVFVRRGCSRCARAKQFLIQVEKSYPAFDLVYRDLVTERGATNDLNQLVRQHQQAAASVPVFHVCNQLQIGWDRDQTSGARLLKLLDTWTVPPPEAQPGDAKADQAGENKDSRPPNARAPVGRASQTAALVSPGIWLALTLPPFFLVAQQADSPDSVPDLPLPQLPLPSDATGRPPPDGDSAEPIHSPDAAQPLYQVELPWLGEVDAREIGLPLFTFTIGLIDGFNPCAMWVLLFLLSLLVNLHSRTRILAVAGSFVVISGLAYFVFMAAWLNVFLLIGLVRPVQVVLGLTGVLVGSIHVKDFFAFKKGLTLSIPERAKPGIYAQTRKIITAENLLAAIVAAAFLAIMVNIVELLCTAGLPALYTQVLANHNLAVWQNYLYLGLYILAYMLDDSLMVGIVVVTLSKTKLQEKQGRWLKLISGLVIIVVGLVMLLCPDWLM